MAEPTCRTCYALSLTRDQRERFYGETVTTEVYYCPEHQRQVDDMLLLFKGIVRKGTTVTGRTVRQFPRFTEAAHVTTPDGEYIGLITQATFEDVDLDRWEGEGGHG